MNPSQSDRLIIKHLDKILFGVASAYLILVLVWLVSQVSKPKEQPLTKPPLSAEDAGFIAYLQQSLKMLDQTSTPKTLVKPTESNLSTVAVTPPGTTPEKIIERIYVPMYPPNSTPGNPGTVTPPSPQTPIKINNIPAPPPLPLPSAAAPPTTVPVLVPGQTSLSVPPEIASNSQPVTNGNHTLVGVLEAGERSSALFTFNGITRRFEIGEAVGNSGGVLMGIQNQKAVIYFNGKTRYLEVGQGL
ncbi:hypothetical protein VB715_09715 [Crocosphaera sp. UHCC 0190]|uniref:hypothetical protein n=1 Tax=Crocosphaera sp. UHCC 0190 TaxID=3110246 RepID=UPI002B21961A|nr:hypothetical protein [Crocosphaera sp. UHCC 0190]MEA5510040.1 hypothetical protein [Crocosphaera sp. UHCC 0190]